MLIHIATKGGGFKAGTRAIPRKHSGIAICGSAINENAPSAKFHEVAQVQKNAKAVARPDWMDSYCMDCVRIGEADLAKQELRIRLNELDRERASIIEWLNTSKHPDRYPDHVDVSALVARREDQTDKLWDIEAKMERIIKEIGS